MKPLFDFEIALITEHSRLARNQIELMRHIHQTGTLTEAAKNLGISYKTACAWLDALNNAAEAPLLLASHGGNSRGRTVLTETGLSYMQQYDLALRHYENTKKEMEGKGNLSVFLQRLRLRTSARNHLHGVVTGITAGMQSLVSIQVSASFFIQSRVSRNAILDMDLENGSRVSAVFKAASVLIDSCLHTCSPRGNNTWTATVRSDDGDSQSREITLDVDGQNTIVALVETDHWKSLQAEEDTRFAVTVNPSHVMLVSME